MTVEERPASSRWEHGPFDNDPPETMYRYIGDNLETAIADTAPTDRPCHRLTEGEARLRRKFIDIERRRRDLDMKVKQVRCHYTIVGAGLFGTKTVDAGRVFLQRIYRVRVGSEPPSNPLLAAFSANYYGMFNSPIYAYYSSLDALPELEEGLEWREREY